MSQSTTLRSSFVLVVSPQVSSQNHRVLVATPCIAQTCSSPPPPRIDNCQSWSGLTCTVKCEVSIPPPAPQDRQLSSWSGLMCTVKCEVSPPPASIISKITGVFCSLTIRNMISITKLLFVLTSVKVSLLLFRFIFGMQFPIINVFICYNWWEIHQKRPNLRIKTLPTTGTN